MGAADMIEGRKKQKEKIDPLVQLAIAEGKIAGYARRLGARVPGRARRHNAVVTTVELARLAEELGIDAIGAAPAAPYTETERQIRERRARGLFADMRFTMAQPEVSCHPETLLPGARTVVSAALCYYAPGGPPGPGEGRLPRYTWSDALRRAAREARRARPAAGRRATACWSTRTSTSTARGRPVPASASTERTRC